MLRRRPGEPAAALPGKKARNRGTTSRDHNSSPVFPTRHRAALRESIAGRALEGSTVERARHIPKQLSE